MYFGYTLGDTIASTGVLPHRELNYHIYLMFTVGLAFGIPRIHLQTQVTYPHLTLAYTNPYSVILTYQEQFTSTILLSHLGYAIATSSNQTNYHTAYPKLHKYISRNIKAYQFTNFLTLLTY